MSTTSQIAADSTTLGEREVKMQRMLAAYILPGLLFLPKPGRFLGVWNLIRRFCRHSEVGAFCTAPA